MNSVLTPSKVTRLFAVAAVSLVSLHLIGQFARFFLGIDTENLIVGFFKGFHILFSGATGVEMFGGRHAEVYGFENPTMVLFQTVEETLEITGILVLIYALTSYIVSEFGDVRLGFAPSKGAPWS